MVSESDLLTRLREILGASDLDMATAGSVRRQMEIDFGVDLSDRKKFIRDQIDIYLETHMGKAEEEAEGEEEVVEGSENAEKNDDVEEEDDEQEEVQVNRGKKKRRKTVVAKRGGFAQICSLSPQLQKFVGEAEMARTEVVKRIWAYIRAEDLQDPKNRQNIRCDESLQSLFKVKSINMFRMNKVLSKHIWPLGKEEELVKQQKKGEESDHSVSEGGVSNVAEQEEEEVEEEGEEEKVSRRKDSKKRKSSKGNKEVKKRGGGFTKLCSLSPELQKFTGVPALARTEVVKKLWIYIREKSLQDPKNKRDIICDETLRVLFEVDKINMFQMNKALSKHIFPLNEEVADNTSQKEMKSKQEQEEKEEEEVEEGSI